MSISLSDSWNKRVEEEEEGKKGAKEELRVNNGSGKGNGKGKGKG